MIFHNFKLIFQTLSRIRILIALICMVFYLNAASALGLKPGDIFADLILIKPGTGAQTISGFQIRHNDGMAFDNEGNILNIYDGAITTHDLITKEQSTLFPNGILSSITGLTVASDGQIFAHDQTSVSRIDPITGQQTILSSGSRFSEILAIAMDANGNVIIGDRGNSTLFAVNPDTGTTDEISSGGSIERIAGIALDANGDYIVLNESASANTRIVKVDRNTGNQSNAVGGELLDSDGNNVFLSSLSDFVIDTNGDFIIGLEQPIGQSAGVYRVDRATGLTTNINSTRFLILDMVTNAAGEVYMTANESFVRGLYRLDLNTGNAELVIHQGPISTNTFQSRAAASQDEIFFLQNGISKIVPGTAEIVEVATGGLLTSLVGIAIEDSGSLVVADHDALSVIRVNPQTGAQSVVSSGNNITSIVDLALDHAGNIYIAPFNLTVDTPIVRIDPLSGDQTVIPFNSFASGVQAVAIEKNGNIIFASSQGIFRVSQDSGVVDQIASIGTNGVTGGTNVIDRPRDLQIASDGTIIVADSDAAAVVLIDPITNVQTVLATGGFIPPASARTGPKFLALVPGEITSFTGNKLTIPVTQVGDTLYRVEMSLIDAGTLTFRVATAELTSNSDMSNVAVFANNVLTIPKVTVGNTAYRAEMTLVDSETFTFSVSSATSLR